MKVLFQTNDVLVSSTLFYGKLPIIKVFLKYSSDEIIPSSCKCSILLGLTFVKLKKSLYGTKQAALNWFELLSSGLQQRGFRASPADPCLFIKSSMIVIAHIDGIFNDVTAHLMVCRSRWRNVRSEVLFCYFLECSCSKCHDWSAS